MPRLGQPRWGQEEFAGGEEDGGVSLPEWTLCLSFCWAEA